MANWGYGQTGRFRQNLVDSNVTAFRICYIAFASDDQTLYLWHLLRNEIFYLTTACATTN